MASPIDPALIAPQSYKPRAKPAADPRARGPQDNAPARPDAGAGRRSQAAVSVSLSAEALAVLSGGRDTPRQARPDAEKPETQAASAARPGFSAEDVSEEAPVPRQREAPFAQVSETRSQRYTAPGSRLDITI
ncbi:MAG: hypothetical protein ACR2PM_20965 [Hyphomicrobiales bacterium]